MSKIAERVLAAIAVLLICWWLSLVFRNDPTASQAWISGIISAVTLAAGWLHKRNKRRDEESAHPLEANDRDQPAYAMAQAAESHGNPLGRWWRR
ncbi:hypothetical protein [Nesterenkonia sp. Act20]|uniref:hypothetical protein n=1 Tax=Nesterenkonia sp. Act20 TaxID=1483432 RepID=UPI001C48D9F5|nr:hypothetical protein [Nesterenkonia sp. Act20]